MAEGKMGRKAKAGGEQAVNEIGFDHDMLLAVIGTTIYLFFAVLLVVLIVSAINLLS